MIMDIEKSIRQAVDTGKVVLGEKETIRAVQNKKVKLVIVSANCRAGSKESLKAHSKLSDIKVFDFAGSGVDIGSVCGKPFVVSMLGVMDAGDSNIFEVGRR
jgi:large subunit ribosomal protein L30e